MKKRFAVALLLLAGTTAIAAEQIGPVHPIVEPDLLKEIHRVLKEKEASGELARLQREGIERAKRSAENPRPVEGVTKTVKARTFYWDPTVTAPRTITDDQGNVVVQAGTRVNPLDYVALPNNMVFFDGRDSGQVTKALQLIEHYKGRAKPILVAGPVAELSRKWKRQFYFDQGGSLVRKLGIRQVPAVVSQDGKRLRIDEVEA
jgi:conjugal transfer pilus assembly protein TraW